MAEGNKKNIPSHVALIMDGNCRWAEERNLSLAEGQIKGFEKLKQSFDWFFLRGVKILSVYLFPAIFWQRDEKEVNHLFQLFRQTLNDSLDDFNHKDCRVVFSGRIDELPDDLAIFCEEIERQTKNNQSNILNICLNYSGRHELLDAIKKIIKNNLSEEQIHEGIIKKYLYNSELVDVEAVIRVGGNSRLADFLIWQSTEAEFFFLKKYWPDFEEMDVMQVLDEYHKRKIKEEKK